MSFLSSKKVPKQPKHTKHRTSPTKAGSSETFKQNSLHISEQVPIKYQISSIQKADRKYFNPSPGWASSATIGFWFLDQVLKRWKHETRISFKSVPKNPVANSESSSFTMWCRLFSKQRSSILHSFHYGRVKWILSLCSHTLGSKPQTPHLGQAQKMTCKHSAEQFRQAHPNVFFGFHPNGFVS